MPFPHFAFGKQLHARQAIKRQNIAHKTDVLLEIKEIAHNFKSTGNFIVSWLFLIMKLYKIASLQSERCKSFNVIKIVNFRTSSLVK